MKKQKLTEEAIKQLILDCKHEEDITHGKGNYAEVPFRDEKNPRDVKKIAVNLAKLINREEDFRYLLGQLAVYHSDAMEADIRKFVRLSDGTIWTNDPVSLNQLINLGVITGNIPLEMEDNLVMLRIHKDKSRHIEPVVHKEERELQQATGHVEVMSK